MNAEKLQKMVANPRFSSLSAAPLSGTWETLVRFNPDERGIVITRPAYVRNYDAGRGKVVGASQDEVVDRTLRFIEYIDTEVAQRAAVRAQARAPKPVGPPEVEAIPKAKAHF